MLLISFNRCLTWGSPRNINSVLNNGTKVLTKYGTISLL